MNELSPIHLEAIPMPYDPQWDEFALSMPTPSLPTPPTSPTRTHRWTPLTLLPSEKRFGSPLKRKRDEKNPEEEGYSVVAKRLFIEPNESELTQVVKSTALEEQIGLINKYIITTIPDQEDEINNYVKKNENASLSVEEKLAELGALYFYLVRDRKLPQLEAKSSFVQLRYEEVFRRIVRCETIHDSNCPKDISTLLPSGKVIELMRACARLIFTPDGSFNLGGCETVKLFLNSAIVFTITEEIRVQMLTIIDKLLKEPEFYKLFLKEYSSIHPDAAELIRIDLFLKPGEEVGNLHVCWEKLISLFFVIGQVNEGNCSAVSTVFNVFRQNPEIILEFYDQMVEKGSLNFFGEEVPLSLLIAGRKSYEKDFNQTLKVSTAVNLTGLSVVRTLFGQAEVTMTKEEDTLKGIFSEQFGALQNDAKHQYLALKRNLFQQTILGFFLFVAINTPLQENDYLSPKDQFCDRINESIYAHFGRPFFRKKISKTFINDFKNYIRRFFYFIDYRNGEGLVENDRIHFAHHSKGLLVEADALSSFRKFSVIRRLFFVKEGAFRPVDTISGFADCFLEMLVSFNELSNDKKKYGDIPDHFEQYFKDKQFKIDLAIINAEINSEEKVPFKDTKYYHSDALILLPNGGSATLLLSSITLNRLYNTIPLKARNVKGLFIKLCDSLRAYIEKNPLFLKQDNPTLPIASETHDFILYPSQFSKFILGDSNALLQHFVIDRARKILSQSPTTQKRESILYDAFDKGLADEILKHLPKKLSSMRAFRTAVMKLLKDKKSKLKSFDQSFENVLTHVTLNNIEMQLPNFLNLCGFKNDASTVGQMIGFLKQCLPVKKFYSLIEVSKFMYYAIISYNFAHTSREIIEEHWADIFELPYVIKLGNLNWVDQLDEAPNYQMLVLKLNLCDKKLILCKRKNGLDIPLTKSFSTGLIKECVLSLPT